MTRVYVRENGGDGILMEGGYAELINCELVGNGGWGMAVQGGDARLKHCGALGNGEGDILSSSPESLWADNCLFGRVAPLSQVALLRHCLVEVLPDNVVVAESEGCLMNVASGCFLNGGEISGLEKSSPCVDAGLEAGVPTDILGNPRVGPPDIGTLEQDGKPIPAFSGVGLLLLSLFTAGVGLFAVRRRKRTVTE